MFFYKKVILSFHVVMPGDYSNWGSNEPHGVGANHDENCVVYAHKKWADVNCDRIEHYICETIAYVILFFQSITKSSSVLSKIFLNHLVGSISFKFLTSYSLSFHMVMGLPNLLSLIQK